ncbi:unnamed protein product, partial [Brenthis ino]
MAITVTGKIVMILVSLAVIGGMTAVILLVINDQYAKDEPVTTTTQPPLTLDSALPYQVGVGIADMTGPCVEIHFMGYAELGQIGEGIHLRQFSRAFIFVQNNTRVVLVTAEVQAVGIAVRRAVVGKLQELYGDMYTLRNVIIAGTHTHSAPGGHLVDFLLDISILGFSRETYDAYVEGITRSIVRAHDNIVPARMFIGQTQVKDAHVNRSPYSYDRNPKEERARYTSNTHDVLTQVRIAKADGELHGVMNWFAVHTTSMNMSNHLISSDNLGYAALQLEAYLNPGRPAGKPSIVAGFFSESLGDVSPNTQTPKCEFSGVECDNQFKLCERFERCFAFGPGEDMFESTRIIGEKIYRGALEALDSTGEEIDGDISVIHQFVEMGQEIVPKYDPLSEEFLANDRVNGCVPAIGYSFASGTTDGANILNITQGTIEGNPLLEALGNVVATPTDADVECHAPKPILLATGRANFPIPWHPHIVSVSLIKLGQFLVLGVPGEPSTMAGRRMRRVVEKVIENRGVLGSRGVVVVSALCNEYIHYVTTFEEYQVQRYEAASTIYGPHTLDIFLHKFHEFTLAALNRSAVPAGAPPADYTARAPSLTRAPAPDARWPAPGVARRQPPATVRAGDIVTVEFLTVFLEAVLRHRNTSKPKKIWIDYVKEDIYVKDVCAEMMTDRRKWKKESCFATRKVGANPRNDLRQESTYGEVQRYELGRWVQVATDADWDTKFYWRRESLLPGTSRATLQWRARGGVLAPHRVLYRGAARAPSGGLTHFTGVSDSFYIQP